MSYHSAKFQTYFNPLNSKSDKLLWNWNSFNSFEPNTCEFLSYRTPWIPNTSNSFEPIYLIQINFLHSNSHLSSEFHRIKSIQNLRMIPKRKLFILKSSSTLQNFTFIGARQVDLLKEKQRLLLKFRKIRKIQKVAGPLARDLLPFLCLLPRRAWPAHQRPR